MMSVQKDCLTCVNSTSHDSGDHNEWSGVDGADPEGNIMGLAPHIQVYLAQAAQRTNCCGFTLPVAFERAAPGSWWNPRFDSPVLERQYRNSSFRQIRLRFRFALLYILLFSLSWFIYFAILGLNGTIIEWRPLCSIFAGVILITTLMLWVTFTNVYKMYTFKMSLAIALALCTLSLSLVVLTTNESEKGNVADVSQSGHFTICIEILLIVYTVTPLPLYFCIIIGVIYSFTFEALLFFLHRANNHLAYSTLFVRFLLQLCVHLIGVHIFLMTFVRMRGTFMKVGQSLLVRRQLEMEKQLKEKMIHSVMPPQLATSLMKETIIESEGSLKNSSMHPRHSSTGASDLKSLFRPFNMNSMDNVSILFADIVGFTKMSSNKSADELVSILNDLFERFDELCQIYGCEKISTLGDCYYCVSGCPEPRPDHASCCVEMGLGMIDAIQEFDRERNEGVNMRVGVHTGTVLCGIVGTRRFKFDVWSNSVTLANKLESSGQPGRVHISEETSAFLSGCYVLEEGEMVCGHKTYFIEGRQSSPSIDNYHLAPKNSVNLKLIISPAISPQSISPIPLPSPKGTGPRKSSRNQLNVRTSQTPPLNPNRLSPNPFNFRAKASSLPSILDSEVEGDEKSRAFNIELDDLSSKSPTSVGSYGKYANKLRNWKVPKFLRKHSDTPLAIIRKEDLKNSHFIETNDPGMSDTACINGYQQVPVVIESQERKVSRLTVPSSSNRLSVTEAVHMPNASSFEKEIIDIRAYLSESRSNMSPFARSSSYRSQYGRTNNYELPPVPRARSSTLATHGDLLRRVRRLSPRPAPVADATTAVPAHAHDDLSLCPSVNSRKDSGIRSTSRRSSIQQQIYVLNQSALGTSHGDVNHHRTSGYCTSSQCSLNDLPSRARLPHPFDPQNLDCIKKYRKQSDLQLIRCVQDNARSRVSYFVQPPLSAFTLFFKSREMEMEYRNSAHRRDDIEESPPTLATSRFNTALDILVSAVIFYLISSSIFLLFEPEPYWLGCFIFFGILLFIAICLCIYRHYVKWKISDKQFDTENDTTIRKSERVFRWVSDWYPWHVSGSLLVSLPVLCILVNFTCEETTEKILSGRESFYIYLVCIGLVHFCNFTQMNWLVKNVLVTVFALIFLLLTFLYCAPEMSQIREVEYNISNNLSNSSQHVSTESKHTSHLEELYIDILLLVFLVWFLNREFEISYRLSFYSNIVATNDKVTVQNLRNQADWLLHNIIPRHVANQLKNTAKYSENHKDVGIIFASIVNFNEMYDESYLRGKEYLRVLNELIGDFDELLEKLEFVSVEKIKTIGSTFMAASGLNPEVRHENSQPHDHLFQLMEFAIAMQKVVDDFNHDLLEFNLILRIGYNYGEVTAGVIGTTKLYYDIWGDAVNIASRMDSTGVNGRIQVGEACLEVLNEVYEFEPRGSVYVKGKDNMNVYLLIGKKEND